MSTVVTVLHDRTEALEKAALHEQLKEASQLLEHKVREATAELVRQNELLRRQRIELEQASALKSQFLANMSHEFCTPLNAILGYTSMLLQGVSGALTAEQRRSLGRVDSNARHLLALINDILDIARIEAGKMPLTLSDVALPELISEVLAELEPIIARAKLAVVSDLPPRLPTVCSDRQKVKQIVLNLLSNALKFTPEESVTVCTRYDAASEQATIAVADTGIGIAPEDQDPIFEDFRQADASPTREYGGAGLGLSICRRLAAMLDGRITLDKAFSLLPDLIVMDLSLPGIDGWEATRRLKADERTKRIPVVALTGHALAGHSKGAQDAGCDAFVTKACLPEDLETEIKRVLHGEDAAPRGPASRAPRSSVARAAAPPRRVEVTYTRYESEEAQRG